MISTLLNLRRVRTGRLLPVVVACLFAVAPAWAQQGNDGSIYSRYGLGQLRAFSSPQAEALGGGGYALLSYNYTNAGNPASLGDQILTRAVLGLTYQGLEATDHTDNTSRLTSGSLQAFQFAFPLLSQRLGVAASFRPYARRNYRVAVEGTLEDPNASDPVPYTITYAGSGGLQEIALGMGYRINRNLSVGGSGSFVFGILEDVRRTSFTTGGYTDAVISESTRLWGFTGTFGALYSLFRPFRENDLLSVGASVALPLGLDGKRARTVGETLDRDTLGTTVPGTVDVPLSARLGLAYRPGARWTFVVDGLYEPWSSFESSFGFAGYEPGGFNHFTDRMRVSGGIEVLPAGDDAIAPYLQRTAYRIGVYYDQMYVNPNGVDIRELAGTVGFSLPTMIPGTRIDLTFELGTRGTTDQELVHDLFYSVSASVNIGERWFTRRKLR